MEENNSHNFEKYLEKIKSRYILKKICNNTQEKIILKIFKYNKNIQKKLI